MKCSICGTENKEGALFCSQCGKALKEDPISLDLEQIKVPASLRKTHIIKVSAKPKEAENAAQSAAPQAADLSEEDSSPADKNVPANESGSESEYIDFSASQEGAETPAEPVADPAIPPMRKRDWLPVFILTAIPAVNFIMLLIWSFSSRTNPSKKSFAQLALIFMIIDVVIGIAAFVLYATLFQGNLSKLSSLLA